MLVGGYRFQGIALWRRSPVLAGGPVRHPLFYVLNLFAGRTLMELSWILFIIAVAIFVAASMLFK